MTTATFYTNSPGPLADGTSYREAQARGHFCAAPRHVPLGTVLAITNARSGRTVTATVRDRGAFGPDVVDLAAHSFAALVGLGWQRVGRVPVRVRVVSVPKRGRR